MKTEEQEKEEEDLPVENPNIVLTIAMNSRRLSFTAKSNASLLLIKKHYLTHLLGHQPTAEELSNYYLSHKDLKLDDSKQIGELNLSSYNLECMLFQRVRIFAEGENHPHVIKFCRSVSVKQIIAAMTKTVRILSPCLTLLNSSIVLKNVISTSCDLARILLILLY